MTMTTDEGSKRTPLPQLIVLNRSFKMAEQWVKSQGHSLDDTKSNEAVLESRPPRLGIGAAVPRQSHTLRSNDPIERKLRAKLDDKKIKILNNAEVSAKVGRVDEESDNEESESKTKAFTKRRPALLSSIMQTKKKKKNK